jgi:hypothetical protein
MLAILSILNDAGMIILGAWAVYAVLDCLFPMRSR